MAANRADALVCAGTGASSTDSRGVPPESTGTAVLSWVYIIKGHNDKRRYKKARLVVIQRVYQSVQSRQGFQVSNVTQQAAVAYLYQQRSL
mgnify:CR=1 FL=1